eukprot:TRINITY_DN222_c0_g1_i2.p1 TRINITY_DN222_c0_g1~~TRINITY_DN222_c0_g1_i2.p1  ORF type:complete len:131 (-),score=14.25 TRINITY_DN222_c0_g1_i2:48-440(-)
MRTQKINSGRWVYRTSSDHDFVLSEKKDSVGRARLPLFMKGANVDSVCAELVKATIGGIYHNPHKFVKHIKKQTTCNSLQGISKKDRLGKSGKDLSCTCLATDFSLEFVASKTFEVDLSDEEESGLITVD